MRKNTRKLLSLILTFLMVFGNVAMMIPQVSAADALAVTFLDESGAEIASVSFTGTTTINRLL